MRTTDPGDAARIELLLAELRLPAVKQIWASLATQADKEGWPAGRFLVALAEHEIAERARRRLERHLGEARLPPGKTLDTFDFEAVPVVSKAQVMALATGDAWLNSSAGLMMRRISNHRQRLIVAPRIASPEMFPEAEMLPHLIAWIGGRPRPRLRSSAARRRKLSTFISKMVA